MRKIGAGAWILAAVLILVGVIALINNAGWVNLGWGVLWPVILIIIGLALVLGHRTAGSPGKEFEHFIGDTRIGEPGWALRNSRLSSGIGNVLIDLTRAQIPMGETVVEIEALIGNIDVLIPAGLAVSLKGRVSLGSVTLLGQKSDGFLREADFLSPGYDAAPSKVRIDASLVIGDIKVRPSHQEG